QVNPTVNTLATAINKNLAVLQTPLAVFVCPSDTGGPLNNNRPYFKTTGPVLAISNYPGNGGNAAGDGVFAENSKIGIKSITGGTQFVLCDGSVRFVSSDVPWTDTAPFKTYNFLGSIADGNVVGDF